MLAPVTAALVLGLLSQAPEPSARFDQRDEGAATLEIRHLPDLFSEARVAANLRTGLSTTIVGEIELRDSSGRRHRHETSVRVRYDLWDEVFLVDSLGLLGRREETAPEEGLTTLRFEDREALAAWWRERRLVLELPAGSRPAGRARLRLVVLPFSQSEEDDARLWFSRSVRRAGSSPPGDRGADADTLLEQAMASAIRGEKLLSYDLRLDVD